MTQVDCVPPPEEDRGLAWVLWLVVGCGVVSAALAALVQWAK